jgi:hypothetical protein
MKGVKKPHTPKAKAFFQLLPTCKTQGEAARKAGFADASADVSATKNIKKYKNYWHELLSEAGCTDEHLAGIIVEGTEATKVIGYLENKNTSKAGKADKAKPDKSVSNDFLDTPDWQARAKFSELALKLSDAFPEAKLKVTTDPPPPDTGTLDQIVANMGKNEQKQFIEMLAASFGA